jgi:hypothetical protein
MLRIFWKKGHLDSGISGIQKSESGNLEIPVAVCSRESTVIGVVPIGGGVCIDLPGQERSS